MAMAQQLGRAGLAFERVGVDLRCVRPAEVDLQIASHFPGLQFDRKSLSNAEIGCWLSHLSAWQALLRGTEEFCTVIEDDLQLAAGFAAAVRALESKARADARFDLVYLGTSSRNVSQRQRTDIDGLAVHRPVGVIFNTWGYSVSRHYAGRFLQHGPRRIHLPIDHYLGGRGGRSRPCIGVLQPTVVDEDPILGAASQIGPYTKRLDRSRLFQNVRRRILASAVSELYYSLYRYL